MKKKEQKRTTKYADKSNDFSSLNSELGSFDLEPPKHYREETRQQEKQAPRKKKPAPASKNDKSRAHKKRSRRSKLFYRVISSVALVLAIICVILVLSCTVFFKIDKIEVEGNKKYSTEQIVQMLPIEKGKNLFASKTSAAQETLEQNLPYIFNAEVKRKFPSTIIVKVTEAPKIYSVKNKDKTYTLLDERLKVLEANAEKRPKKSVAIKGVEVKSALAGDTITFKSKKTKDCLLAMTEIINSMKLDEITALSSVDVNTNSLVYDGRIVIKVGTVDKLEGKLYSALTAIEKLNESDPNAKGTITATGGKQIYFTEE